MPKFEFCLPTTGNAVPAGPDWFHEIKYDGYRLRIERDGATVRLITRGGHDWTRRFPWIAEAALRNRSKQFVIDGEAVVLSVNGISDFNALHSGKQNAEVQLAPSTCWRSTARTFGSPAVDAQSQPGETAARPRGRHLRQSVRDRRDRTRAIPGGLRYGPRRHGLEALRSTLSRRAIAALDQGEEQDFASNE
jgi:hypothetical protein